MGVRVVEALDSQGFLEGLLSQWLRYDDLDLGRQLGRHMHEVLREPSVHAVEFQPCPEGRMVGRERHDKLSRRLRSAGQIEHAPTVSDQPASVRADTRTKPCCLKRSGRPRSASATPERCSFRFAICSCSGSDRTIWLFRAGTSTSSAFVKLLAQDVRDNPFQLTFAVGQPIARGVDVDRALLNVLLRRKPAPARRTSWPCIAAPSSGRNS